MPYRPKMFTKWVVRSRKWKDRHYNSQKNKETIQTMVHKQYTENYDLNNTNPNWGCTHVISHGEQLG